MQREGPGLLGAGGGGGRAGRKDEVGAAAALGLPPGSTTTQYAGSPFRLQVREKRPQEKRPQHVRDTTDLCTPLLLPPPAPCVHPATLPRSATAVTRHAPALQTHTHAQRVQSLIAGSRASGQSLSERVLGRGHAGRGEQLASWSGGE